MKIVQTFDEPILIIADKDYYKIFKNINGTMTLKTTLDVCDYEHYKPKATFEFTYDTLHLEEAYCSEDITPQKIIKNPAKCATTVKWEDGTYTTVKRSPDDPEDDYAAFTAALAIKLYGSNSALKRMLNKKTEILNKKKKEKEDARSEQN